MAFCQTTNAEHLIFSAPKWQRSRIFKNVENARFGEFGRFGWLGDLAGWGVWLVWGAWLDRGLDWVGGLAG